MASLPTCIRSWQESLSGATVGTHRGTEGTQDQSIMLDRPTSVTEKTQGEKKNTGREENAESHLQVEI